MTLTPDDIEKQVFKERFRGYDQDEVDRFLDQVSDSIGELMRQRDDLHERVRLAEREAAQADARQDVVEETLLAAQRSADETVYEARATAEQALQDARTRAEEIVAEARHLVGEQDRQAHAVQDHVRRVVADLSRLRTEYRERVAAVIADQLSLLDRAGGLPEVPDALRRLADQDPPPAGDIDGDGGGYVYWEHGTGT